MNDPASDDRKIPARDEMPLSSSDESKLTIAVITDLVYMRRTAECLMRAVEAAGHQVVEVRPDKLLFEVIDGSTQLIYGDDNKRVIVDGAILSSAVYSTIVPVLESLRGARIPCVNSPEATQISSDKFITHVRLARAGIPMPRTGMAISHAQAISTAERFGYPIVFKALEGAGGEQVTRAYDAEDAREKLAQISNDGDLVIVQEYLEFNGISKRIVVVDGEIVGAVLRTADGGEFRANFDTGAEGSMTEVTPEEAKIALAAAKESGLNVIGVDVGTVTEDSPRPGGPKKGDVVLFEINSVPGVADMEEITGLDVSGAIVRSLVGRIQSSMLHAEFVSSAHRSITRNGGLVRG